MENIPSSSSSRKVEGPKALFWYLSLFFTLGITAFALGGIWFQFINNIFPSEVFYSGVGKTFSQEALKAEIAAIMIAAPVFFLFSWMIRKAINENNLSPDNRIRTWITYIILFIVIAIAIGDLISFVLTLLNGDFTARFILKALTILVIVGWIFGYYFSEVKSENALKGSLLPKVIAIISAIVILASFIGAFFLVDSPKQTRLERYDLTRENDLQQIRYAIENYYTNKGSLPANLNEVQEYYGRISVVDPQSAQSYEYEAIDEDTYSLCAVFETSNKDNEDPYNYFPTKEQYPPIVHEAQRTCFEQSIPEIVKTPQDR